MYKGRMYKGCLYLLIAGLQLQGPVIPLWCFLWGDKNLFQTVPSRGLRLPCSGPADKAAPHRHTCCEQGAEPSNWRQPKKELCPDLIRRARATPRLAPRQHPVSQRRRDLCTRKPHFYSEGGQTLAQDARRGCGDSMLGGIQNPAGHSPGQPAVGDPAWPGSVDQMVFRGPCQPQPFRDSENSSLPQSTATKSDFSNGTEKMVTL